MLEGGDVKFLKSVGIRESGFRIHISIIMIYNTHFLFFFLHNIRSVFITVRSCPDTVVITSVGVTSART